MKIDRLLNHFQIAVTHYLQDPNKDLKMKEDLAKDFGTTLNAFTEADNLRKANLIAKGTIALIGAYFCFAFLITLLANPAFVLTLPTTAPIIAVNIGLANITGYILTEQSILFMSCFLHGFFISKGGSWLLNKADQHFSDFREMPIKAMKNEELKLEISKVTQKIQQVIIGTDMAEPMKESIGKHKKPK